MEVSGAAELSRAHGIALGSKQRGDTQYTFPAVAAGGHDHSHAGTPAGCPSEQCQTCLSGGCHSMETLRQPLFVHQTYFFDHLKHLGSLPHGPELRCTSCHTAVDTESHFAADTNACFTCHFQTATKTRPATAIGCVGRHGVPTRTAAGFDHVAGGVTATDAACRSCHEPVSSGSPAVETRQRHHCHAETPATLLPAGTPFIHRKHVTDKGLACDWCHGGEAQQPGDESLR